MGKLISVVIPTRDSEASIGSCLQSIERQGYRDFEIIVVDGNSRDRTREIALRAAKVMTTGAPVPEARNLGFASARGEILVSIDSDMILEDGLLQDIAERMDGFGALVIPELGCGRGIAGDRDPGREVERPRTAHPAHGHRAERQLHEASDEDVADIDAMRENLFEPIFLAVVPSHQLIRPMVSDMDSFLVEDPKIDERRRFLLELIEYREKVGYARGLPPEAGSLESPP